MPFLRLLYGGTIFLGAFLLFLVEPMAAKQILPTLGGSSAVWITCLVFFQVALFLGYLYAHWLSNGKESIRAIFHSVFLVLCGLTLLFTWHPAVQHPELHPLSAIFLGLGAFLGLPFLALSSTSPLLQVWMARAEGSSVPYKLFALSNLGSLLALALYPSVIEPRLSLANQWHLWRAGFLVYMALCLGVAWRVRQSKTQPAEASTAERSGLPPVRLLLLWFFLPAAASMQLSSVTSYLTQNIAAIPLLWVIPLAAYLLTFILAFDFPRLYSRSFFIRLLLVFLASIAVLLSHPERSVPISIGIVLFMIELFVSCYFCHAELYALRPKNVGQATLYYLMIVAGGAAGTFFVGIASPVFFQGNYDLPLAFLATAALVLAVMWSEGWLQRALWVATTIGMLVLGVHIRNVYQSDALVMVRNFYGVLRVRESHFPPQAVTSRTLLNGSIEHGMEWFAPEFVDKPASYYSEDSGVGVVMRNPSDHPRKIGVIGLGSGTLAVYARQGDSMQFYEINPLVERVARHFFTYLRNSKANVSVVNGDARISLSAESPQNFDVLIVDAFSGDAIPVHLLTKEAFDLYKRHLRPGGTLVFHVSNQFLNLEPVVTQLADSIGMQARIVHSASNEPKGLFAATWIIITADQQLLSTPQLRSASQLQISSLPTRLWTDDYSSLLPILRWK